MTHVRQFFNLVIAPEVTSSWTYTLSSERIPTEKTPCEAMAEQLAEAIPLIRELDGVVNLDFSRRSRSGV